MSDPYRLVILLTCLISMTTGQVTVYLLDTNIAVNEGEQFKVRVQKQGQLDDELVVVIAIDIDRDDDFIGDTQVARFSPSADTDVAMVTFTVRDDDIAEENEVHILRIMPLFGRTAIIVEPSQTRVTIRANDDAFGVFSFTQESPTVVKEDKFTRIVDLPIHRARGTFGQATVSFTVNGSSLEADVERDITPNSGIVRFLTGEADNNLQLQIRADSIPENAETFFIYLESSDVETRVDRGVMQLVIEANDAPLGFRSPEYRFSEGPDLREYTIEVTRGIAADGSQIGSISETVTVQYSIISRTAFNNMDFIAQDGQLEFAPRETLKTISFSVVDDELPEMDETFEVRLSNSVGDVVWATPNLDRTTVIISANDNPSGVISFYTPNSTTINPQLQRNEDEIETVNFVVIRSAGTFGEVRVSWELDHFNFSISQGAQVTSDVGPFAGDIYFEDGDSEAVISLTIVQDLFPEPAEKFVVRLIDATGDAKVEGVTEAYLLIEDSDIMYGSIEFDSVFQQQIVTTLTSRSLKLQLSRTGGRSENLIANISLTYFDNRNQVRTDQVLGADYFEMRLLQGVDIIEDEVPLLSSAFLETGGSFKAQIIEVILETVPPYGYFNSPVIGSRTSVTIPVSADDANGEIGFASTDEVMVEEPFSGSLPVPLRITREGSSGRVTLDWSLTPVGVGQEYVSSEDFTSMSGSLTMETGVSTIQLPIFVQGDSVPEINETVTVTLSISDSSIAQRLRPGSTEVNVTVLANDNPSGVFEFSQLMRDSYEIEEGSESVTIIVERSGGTLTTKEVRYQVEPEGTTEFYGGTNVLRFEPGETRVTATLIAKADGVPELSEFFTLRLFSYGTPQSVMGPRTSIQITVLKNDVPHGMIQFSMDPTVINMGESTLTNTVTRDLVVQRSRGTFGVVSLTWSLSGNAIDDLTPMSGTLTFPQGIAQQTITIQSVPDDIPESTERYILSLSPPDGGAVPGVPTQAEIIIQENDHPMELTEILQYAQEPSTVFFTIRRSGNLLETVKVRYRTLDASASELEKDFQPVNQEIEFEPGVAQKSFSISVLDDDIPEGNETFLVQLYDLGGDFILTNRSTATVLILANDDAYGVFRFQDPLQRDASEGETLYFDILRNQGSHGEVDVSWFIRDMLTNQIVAGEDEFETTSGVVKFLPGQTQLPIIIHPLSDNEPENDKSYDIVLSSVDVVSGRTDVVLARLDVEGTVATVTVKQSDEPYGRFAFPFNQDEINIPEDYLPGRITDTNAVFTVERQQGVLGTTQVLWEVYSKTMGGNPPKLVDLTFVGNRPAGVTTAISKQRPGTGTQVLLFTGSSGNYLTVAPRDQPLPEDIVNGFSLSAWVQPISPFSGYILSKTSSDGLQHYYSLKMETSSSLTSIEMVLARDNERSQTLPARVNRNLLDNNWHHILVSVGNGTCWIYFDGSLVSSRALIQPDLVDEPGTLLVGARAPGDERFTGYMQDVRVFYRSLVQEEVVELYEMPAMKDVTPISGILMYSPGLRTATFTVSSIQDIEEEGNEVFTVTLISANGGAIISDTGSIATLTVLKSDNANGLFGFQQSCTPSETSDEGAAVTCMVGRTRGDSGTVTVTWIIQQDTNSGYITAVDDFEQFTGMLVFGPGEREKVLQFQIKEEEVPEQTEIFRVLLSQAVSDDGIAGSTNQSGASIDPLTSTSSIIIKDTDFPYGLLQFSDTSVLPSPDDPIISPATGPITVYAREEEKVASLLVVRAQGLIGQVSAEWRTTDITALSEGKTPPDYVGAASRIFLEDNVRYAFLNITLLDNIIPEPEKSFSVELVNPVGGASVGLGSVVNVVIEASDGAFGIYQFSEESISVQGEERGDVGYTSLSLTIDRLGGSYGVAQVTWQALDDTGNDLVDKSGTVRFAAEQVSAQAEIRIRGDTEPELDELIKIVLTASTEGDLGENLRRTSTVTILANDDPYGMFVIASSFRPITVQEENTGIMVTIQRMYGKFGTVDVSFESLPSNVSYPYLPGQVTRANYDDFMRVQGTDRFLPDQEFATFEVTILDDDLPELDESVFVQLTSALLNEGAQPRVVPESPRLGPETQNYGQIIITSNDDASGVVQLSASSLEVEEDVGPLELYVLRSGGTFGEITVRFRTVDQEARNLQDYIIIGTEVILSDGELRKRVPIDIENDRIPEFTEMFTIELLTPVIGGAALGTVSRAVVSIQPSDDPNGAFEFARTGMEVGEPETAQPLSVEITVIRTGGLQDVVTVNWEAMLNGEMATADISPASGSLFFVTNEGSRRIQINILPDDIPEGEENIIITLTGANNGRITEKNTFTLTIRPNDNPHGVVQFVSSSFSLTESDEDQFVAVQRVGGTYGRLRVFYTTSQTPLSSLAAEEGQTAVSYFGDIRSGRRSEVGTVVDLTGSSDPLATCAAVCLDREDCLGFGYRSDNPQCDWYRRVLVSASLFPDENWKYYTKNATKVSSLDRKQARSGTDYGAVVEESFIMEDQVASAQIQVNIMNDTLPELEEKFQMILLRVVVDDPDAMTSQNPVLGVPKTAEILIPANDAANGMFRVFSSSLSATLTEVSVEERDSQAVDLIVERTGGTIGEVSVDWSVAPGPTATYGQDFIADGATLSFAAGQSRRIVTVTVLGDETPENNETFTIQLSNPTGGATIGPQSSIDVVILENDNVAGVIGLDTTAYLAEEGDTFTLRVSRTEPAHGTVTVNWNMEGKNGLQPQEGFREFAGELQFAPGEMLKVISLTVLVDDTPEVNEEYTLTLSGVTTQGVGPTGEAIINPQRSSALITIGGSNQPHGIFQFAATSLNVRVDEEVGRVNLQVDRKFGAIGVVRVSYTILQGSVTSTSSVLELASPDVDFGSVANGYIDIANGESAGTIVVDIENDDIPEIDEVFIVTLTSVDLQGDTSQEFPPQLNSNVTSEIIINANDGAKGVVVFGPDSRDVHVKEDEMNITLAVIRERGTFGNISVFFYSQSNGATNGQDFTVTPQEIVFTSGETHKDMLIQIHSDTAPEPHEKFEVLLDNPQNGAAIGQYATATVTILANDVPGGIIEFSDGNEEELREPQGDNLAGSKLEITLYRGPGIFGVVNVPFTITSMEDDRPVNDIIPASGTIVFNDFMVRSTIELQAVDDNIPEEEEMFLMKLQAPNNGAILGNKIQKVIKILPNDSPQGLFEIFVANTRNSTTAIEENMEVVHLDVIRSRGAEHTITVDVSTVAETALTQESSGEITLALLQSIQSADISGWYSFMVRNSRFILMLTSLPESVTLRSRLPTGPYGGDGQSVLFRWQGEATYMETVNTNGATAAVSFTLEDVTYLVIANGGSEGDRVTDSPLYIVSEEGRLSMIQVFRTTGASDVKFVTHDNQNFLILSNELDSSSRSDLTIDIYIWNKVTRQFGIVPLQSIKALYIKAITLFELDGILFMAAASYYDYTTSSHETNSILYKMGSNYRFSQQQSLSTKGALDVEFVDTGTMQLLVFANNRQNIVRSPQQSAIYRYDSASQRFLNHQFLETTRARTVATTTDGENVYLAFANAQSSSEVFRWNRETSVFDSVWTGVAHTVLEPITIQQDGGHLLLLAGTPVETDQESILYQIADVDLQSDFVPRVVTMTFYPGQTLLHTTAVVLQDKVPEDSETFRMELKNPTSGAEIGLSSSVTVTILSNDNAHGIIEFSDDSLSLFADEKVGEDNPVQLTVVRRAGFFGRVVVKWVASGDHSGTSDISPLEGQVEFANGQSLSTITLTVRDDEEAEQVEETYIRLTEIIETGSSRPGTGAILGVQRTSRVTVQANDSPHGVVFWDPDLRTTVEPEGTDLTLTLNIRRDQGSEGTIRLHFVTSTAVSLPLQQQAVAGDDYVSRNGFVTMATGETSAQVEITIKQDDNPEPDESFYVNITSVELDQSAGESSSRPSVREPGSYMTVTITENDDARGRIEFNVVLTTEGRVDTGEVYGSSYVLRLPLRRSIGLFGEVSVIWEAQPLEAYRDDFSPPGGSVRFESGQDAAVIEITIIDDDIPEPMERFKVILRSVNGGADIGQFDTVTVAIKDNDAPTGLFRFATTEVTTAEATSSDDPEGRVTLLVERVQGAQGLVLVGWRLEADAQNDFLPELQGELTFNEGDGSKPIVLQTKPDDILEGEERFTVSLTSASNGANIDTQRADATIIIQANQDSSGTVAIEPTSRLVYIGEPGESAPNYDGRAEIVLNRGSGIFGPISVTWSLSPREAQGFLQVEGTVNFVDLQQTATVVLQAKDDTVPELRKTYTFVISSATGGAVISPEPKASVADVVFVASDYPHGRFEFSLPQTMTVDENVGRVSVEVRRQDESEGSVQVTYTSSPGTAEENQDFFRVAGTLQFEQGIQSQNIEVTIMTDDEPEGPEQFYLNLTSARLLQPSDKNFTQIGSLQLDMEPGIGSADVKTIVIQKNDNAEGTIQFSPDSVQFTVHEADLVAKVPITRTGGSYGMVSVRYDVQNGTAIRGEDFLGVGGEVIFDDGVNEMTIDITLIDDREEEFDETFIVILVTTSGGAQLGTPTTATVTIAKSDYPNGRFGFRGRLEYEIENRPESTDITLEIERTGGLLGQQTLTWQLMGPNNPDRELDDTTDIVYVVNGGELTSGTFTWEDAEAGVKEFTLQIKGYAMWEIEEVFVVKIVIIQGPVTVGSGEVSPTDGQVTIKIKKHGNPNGIIEFDGAALVRREFDEPTTTQPLTVVFPFSRKPPTGVVGVVQVFWEVEGPTDLKSDLQPTNGSVFLADGDRSGVITLNILPDEIPELTEEFTVVIKSIDGGADVGEVNSRSVFTVRYNDNPHGLYGILPENQRISVTSSDLSRRIHLNFTRHAGSFGSSSLEYTITYDETQTGIIVSPTSGSVTFQDGDSSATSIVAISGDGFLELGTTFTVLLQNVRFIGSQVTDPPRLKAGETQAKIPVPAPAANSQVSFQGLVLNVDNDRQVTLTLARRGTYGAINIDWVAGLQNTVLPPGFVNGEITPQVGTVMMTHEQETEVFTIQVSPQIIQPELFAVRIPGPPKTSVLGGARVLTDQSVARIEPHGLIQFDVDSLTPDVTESQQQVTLRVQRLYGSEGRVEVKYTTEEGTAVGNRDYTHVQDGTIVLRHGDISSTFTIDISQDNQPEVTEIFYVNLTQVTMFPTPVNPIPSPRVNLLYSRALVTIRESVDVSGVLCLEPFTLNAQERYNTVLLQVQRKVGLHGRVTVRVRTVGGGETWSGEITPRPEATTDNTISEAMGNREPNSIATGGLDYKILDALVIFEDGESSKQVNVTILGDDLPEPEEVVLVYLSSPEGGARIATGVAQDAGKRGYSMIKIEASDTSNGRIGFHPDSQYNSVDEDVPDPVATLTLLRLDAFFGEVTVSWKTKISTDSDDAADSILSDQLETVRGVTVCSGGLELCSLEVRLKDDTIPEEEFQFVVILEKVEVDAELNQGSLVAVVVIKPSDFVRGQIGFASSSKMVVVGDNQKSVSLAVERNMGQDYEVEVSYNTVQIPGQNVIFTVQIYPALEGNDFSEQIGTLNFPKGRQSNKQIDVNLTPVLASDNPLPKKFRVQLKNPTNGASLAADRDFADILIVRESNVAFWRAILASLDGDLTDAVILGIVTQLDRLVRNDLTDNNMKLLEGFLDLVNEEGDKRGLSPEAITAVKELYCKLMEDGRTDARKGRASLAKLLENFSYTLVSESECPDPSTPGNPPIVTHECANVRISAGRWPDSKIAGYKYDGQRSDEFSVPNTISGLPATNSGCQDFHMIEYNSDVWFQTEDAPELLTGKVISFGIKNKPSAYTNDPVTFKIHSPDRRVSTSRAQCVYFDEAVSKWTNPNDVCEVTNIADIGTDDFVDCSCKHMTSYAVVAKTLDPGLVYYELWFYICCAICMACLLLVLVLHHLCSSQPMISASLFMHLIFAAMLTQLCLVLSTYLSRNQVLLVGSVSDDNYRCIVMGLFMHYFFIAQFTWILTQAVNLWKLLVLNDEHTERKFFFFFILGWGLPLVIVGVFYAVVYNLYKYVYTLPLDFIYGDVNNNNEVCFITNPYAALGGVIVPALLMLVVVCIIFIKAFQMASQWEQYDDIYRGRYNRLEIKLLLFVYGLVVFTWLWAGLHMVYGQLWMMILFCIFDLTLGLVVFILYGVLRNPCMPYTSTHKASYAVSVGDFETMAAQSGVPHYNYQPSPGPASLKGSRASLLHEAWERDSPPRSQMTVKRALPSQVYINPPISIISPPSHSDIEDRDFDDLLYALKAGGSFAPSEVSRSIADDASIDSERLEHYETKRIDIADTHL